MKRRVNFLFLAGDGYPPFRMDVAVLFGQELIKKGHRIDWILTSKQKLARPCCKTWKGGRVWVGANRGNHSLLHKSLSRLLGFLNDCKSFFLVNNDVYDFIQVKDKFIGALPAILAARMKGLPFVFWLSFPYPEEALYLADRARGWEKYFFLIKGMTLDVLLYRAIIPMSARTFVQSDQMKKNMVLRGIDPERLIPVPMGVSLKDLPKIKSPAAFNPAPGSKKIVYIGTLSRIRKMDFLIRMLALVIKKKPETLLYLVGSGNSPEDEDFLRNEARRLGVENKVVMTGFVPMQDAWQYVLAADVCVSPFFPSPILDVASPTKLIEYMALGKAVVANDHPDQSKVISESNGGLCVPYSESEFSRAVVKLLWDPELCKKMGKNGQDYIRKNRAYTAIADRVEKEYQMIVSGCR